MNSDLPMPNESDATPNQAPSLSTELVILVLKYLSLEELMQCAKASRLFNLIAVSCAMDTERPWDPTQPCTLVASPRPYHTPDRMSILLRSAHIKTLDNVTFDLNAVLGRDHAIGTFRKMWALAERISMRKMTVRWRTHEYNLEDRLLRSHCHAMGGFFGAAVARGCVHLELHSAWAHLARHYQFRGPEKRGSGTMIDSIVQKINSHLPIVGRDSEPALLSDEVNYERTEQGRAWIMMPPFQNHSALTALKISSTFLLQPPFSSWIFSLMKASPIRSLTVDLDQMEEYSDDERQLILKRLRHAVSDIKAIHIPSAVGCMMKEVLTWAASFIKLETLSLGEDCFYGFFIDRDAKKYYFSSLDLHNVRFPRLKELNAPLPFLHALFDPEKSAPAPRTSFLLVPVRRPHRFQGLANGIVGITTRFDWDEDTSIAQIEEAVEAVRCIQYAMQKSLPYIPQATPCLQVMFEFAPALANISHVSTKIPKGLRNTQSDGAEYSKPADISHPALTLEILLHRTVEDLRRGDVDDGLEVFLEILPDTACLILIPGMGLSAGADSALDEPIPPQLFKRFKQVCPGLNQARIIRGLS